MEPLQLTSTWIIPAHDLSVRFVRSGGPGGQNVNKVATKAELRLHLTNTEALSKGQKARLGALYPSALTKEGEFIVVGDEYRSQLLNLEATRRRLRQMVLRAEKPPRPRRPTKPSRAQKEKRMESKHHRSRIKSQRSGRFE
jgi:ribosome-associated protein